MKKQNFNFRFVLAFIFMLITIQTFSATITITPTGGDDSNLIQSKLDILNDYDTLQLNGNFQIQKTIFLPSKMTWYLNGTLTIMANGTWTQAGWVGTIGGQPIDATQRTAITEKNWDTTSSKSEIEMYGGTYLGNNGAYPTTSIRFINFVRLTNSNLYDFTIQDGSDDLVTLGPGCNHNIVRKVIGKRAGSSLTNSGNALNDKGEYNKWYDCVAEDCTSDGWTPKCRYSEFYNCIGRNNVGPGWGMYCRVDGSSSTIPVGEAIKGNKFINCEAYGNLREGFSFDVSSTCGNGGIIEGNYIQAIAYNNKKAGVMFRNKRIDSYCQDNEIDIITWGNLCQKDDGTIWTVSGGLGTEQVANAPVRRITGSIISFDNAGRDVNVNNATYCNINVYKPSGETAPDIYNGISSNVVTENSYTCGSNLTAWCQKKYCGVVDGSFQAESAAYSGPTLKTTETGHFGTGYLDYSNASGDYIEWTVNVPSSGTYDLKFRYALLSGDRPLQLKVNGVTKVTSLSFPATEAWNLWDYVISSQSLNSGNNTIRLTAIGSSGGNFDELIVMPTIPVTGVALTPSTVTKTIGATQQLTATVTPTNASVKTVTFATNNAAVATVSSTGLVTALTAGSATITVTTQDGGKTATSVITVTAPVYLDDCDASTNWTNASANTLTVSTTKKQGTGSLQCVGSGTDEFKKTFSPVYNSGITEANGVLSFWYYVSDITKCSTVKVELGSGGTNDVNEYQWSLSGLVNGWNQISLNTSAAAKTGTPNMNALNWFRLYDTKTASITTRIDAIEVKSTQSSSQRKALVTSKVSEIIPNQEGKSITIYPNPYKQGTLSLDIAGFETMNDVKIKVTNLLGQVIHQENGTNKPHLELNISEKLSEAVYFISVESGETKLVKKLIVK